MNKTDFGKMTIERHAWKCDYCGKSSRVIRRTVIWTGVGHDWMDSLDDVICLRCAINGSLRHAAYKAAAIPRRLGHLRMLIPAAIKDRGFTFSAVRLTVKAYKALRTMERRNGR